MDCSVVMGWPEGGEGLLEGSQGDFGGVRILVGRRRGSCEGWGTQILWGVPGYCVGGRGGEGITIYIERGSQCLL